MPTKRPGQKIDVQRLQEARARFTQLVATNPNYFGTLKGFPLKPVFPLKGNTTFEKLTCVGFNPELNLLEATVQIMLPNGYQGDLCHAGSTEFVRFYVDYGAGWHDVGVASFKAHDIPNGRDCNKDPNKPLTYAVSLPHDPSRGPCANPTMPEVRAVLSWEHMPPPGTPNWIQVWGNTVDHQVFVKPRPRRFLEFFPEGFELPFELEWLEQEPIPIPDPPPELTIGQLAKVYAVQPTSKRAKDKQADEVAAHRFGAADIETAVAPGLVSSSVVAGKIQEWNDLGLDWIATVQALEVTAGDVSFEEVDCVGLDYNREWLVANFTIKRPSGYSGTPCRGGSYEHVAFWADYDDTCTWTYVGTASVKVHDIANLPAGGLHYWVGVPAGLGPHRAGCEEPKIARVRAVLSWNSPPSATDPDLVPHWGNRLDTHVEVKPGAPVSTEAAIDILGGISVSQIDVFGSGRTIPNAVFAEWGSPADPYAPTRTCPFGRRINVQADVPPSFAAGGFKYRLVTRKSGSLAEFPVITPFLVASGINPPVWRSPDPATGYIGYVDPSQNVFNMLGWWESGNVAPLDKDALWEIRLEMVTAGGMPLGATAWHKMQLDHTSPDAAIQIDAGGDCKDFTVGTPVTGRFVARDANFGHWRLNALPDSLGPPDPTTGTAPSAGTALPPGDPWELATAGLDPCGYVVEVEVWDRTIVGSHPSGHHYARDDTGFCLRAPA